MLTQGIRGYMCVNACIVQQVQRATVLSDGDANVYVGQRVQGRHPYGDTPARMEYAPLEMMFQPL